jgi:hypothetical protein
MSTSNHWQTTHLSPSSNFTQIFKNAVDEYKRLTKQDLHTHPFSAALNACDTPDAILDVFRGQAQDYNRFREADDKLMRWLRPTIEVLFTVSATVALGVSLVSSFFPALCFAIMFVS